MEKYFAQNRPMPVALSLGHDPLLFMASAFEVCRSNVNMSG
jgi:3-polyprenyl-4-hydroxybenzoate decarboxylase